MVSAFGGIIGRDMEEDVPATSTHFFASDLVLFLGGSSARLTRNKLELTTLSKIKQIIMIKEIN